jgi:hypothetical protein
VFKIIEKLEINRAQRNAKAYPRQVMVTKCGGEDGGLIADIDADLGERRASSK